MAPGAGIVTDATGLFLIAIAPIPVMERLPFLRVLGAHFGASEFVPISNSTVLVPAPKNVKTLLGKKRGKFHRAVVNLLEKISKLSFGGALV